MVDEAPEAIAMQQYQTLMAYLAYENTIWWTRANYFLLASTALLAFVVAGLPPLERDVAWTKIVAVSVMSLTGAILALFWWKSLRAGDFWIDRWHELLKQIEPRAFGSIKVIRSRDTPEAGYRPPPARAPTRHTVILFVVLWALVFAYSLIGAGVKLWV